jgi:hypothetical protein
MWTQHDMARMTLLCHWVSESACLQDTQHLSSTLVVCRDWFHMLAQSQAGHTCPSTAVTASTYRKQIL